MNAVSGALDGGDQQQQPPTKDPLDQQQQQDPNPQQQHQPPAWMGNLADASLREGDVAGRLSRYGSVDDVAKALIETQDFARGRVALPKEGDDQSYQDFIAKVRPENADAYQFEVPEGDSGAMVDAFRPVAHQLGLTKQQAEGVAQFYNRQQGEVIAQHNNAGQQELKAFEIELSPEVYNHRLEAASNMLAAIPGMEDQAARDQVLASIEQSVGPRKTMEFLFNIAERTGELEKVDGDAVAMRMGGLSTEQAKAKVNEKMNDKDWMKLAATPGTSEHEMWKGWNRIIAGG